MFGKGSKSLLLGCAGGPWGEIPYPKMILRVYPPTATTLMVDRLQIVPFYPGQTSNFNSSS